MLVVTPAKIWSSFVVVSSRFLATEASVWQMGFLENDTCAAQLVTTAEISLLEILEVNGCIGFDFTGSSGWAAGNCTQVWGGEVRLGQQLPGWWLTHFRQSRQFSLFTRRNISVNSDTARTSGKYFCFFRWAVKNVSSPGFGRFFWLMVGHVFPSLPKAPCFGKGNLLPSCC